MCPHPLRAVPLLSLDVHTLQEPPCESRADSAPSVGPVDHSWSPALCHVGSKPRVPLSPALVEPEAQQPVSKGERSQVFILPIRSLFRTTVNEMVQKAQVRIPTALYPSSGALGEEVP